jgi:hypothetical protein
MSDVVHVVNGDCTAEPLAETELPGDILVWADALDQGPLLPSSSGPGTGDAEHRGARARFLASYDGATSGDAAAIENKLAGWDEAIDRAAQDAEEIVLWYEHDLFDQLALVRLLARFTARPRKATLSMVSIDHHPEVPDFKGLGQLEPQQLAGLWPRRTPIGGEALDEAAATWTALCASDPRAVQYLARRAKALPFLGPALWRWLEDLPSVGSGLARTEAELLRAVHRGATTVPAVMAEMQSSDRIYLVSDTVVKRTADRLLALGALTAPLGESPVLTPLGEALWKGNRDRVAELGIDDWRGGVRLVGKGPVWRWDSGPRRPMFV